MRTLTLSEGTFDRTNTFAVMPLRGDLRRRCSLMRDMNVRGDGILWAMQHSTCLSSTYSQDEIAERERLNNEEPLRNGDQVNIAGAVYRVRVLGDYSDMAIFYPV